MSNYIPATKYPITENDAWKSLSGELPVRMTNDYLFKALLQSDNETLKAILASLLHMPISRIKSAKIKNEILLGTHIDAKTFILDVNIELNNRVVIDLEMQVVKEEWWADRSISYICRSFDKLNRGDVYDNAKAVRQIAFCDFTLFEKSPEFYATYKIVNVKNPKSIYSEKFIISNIDLTKIDLATKQDKKYGIDRWARLFKAETWEDMKMLAKEDKTMERAISGVWQLTEEEAIREECLKREEWLMNYNWEKEKQARTAEENKKLKERLKQKNSEIKQKDTKIAELEEELRKAKAN